MSLAVLCAALFSAAPPPSTSAGESESKGAVDLERAADNQLVHARDYTDRHQYRLALTGAEMALCALPPQGAAGKRMVAEAILGDARLALQQFDEAKKCYEAIIKLAAKNEKSAALADGLDGLALVSTAEGNYAAASQYLDRTLVIRKGLRTDHSSNIAHTYIAMAELALHKKRYVDAMRALERAEHSTNSGAFARLADISITRGRVYEAQKNYRLAEQCYKKALDFETRGDPPFPSGDVYMGLGRLASHDKKYAQAADLYTRAAALFALNCGSVKLPPAQAEYAIGEALWQSGNYRKALRHFKTALAVRRVLLKPTDPHVIEAETAYNKALARTKPANH